MIQVTESAQTQLSRILPPGGKFRVTIESGGCSGFEKKFKVCQSPQADDIEFNLVVTDPLSLGFLENSVLDYKVGLAEQKFVLSIPEASVSCGCGKSFNF